MNVNTAKEALQGPPKVNFLNLLVEAAAILVITSIMVMLLG